MKKLIPFIILLFAITTFVYSQTLPEKWTEASVDYVVDGDTAKFFIDGKSNSVRFYGIDAPEENCYGYLQAKGYLQELLTPKRRVYLEKDVSELEKANRKEKRLVRYVWLELPKDINAPTEEEMRSNMVNALQLLNGYAVLYTFATDVKYLDYFIKFQKEAREGKKGLWK